MTVTSTVQTLLSEPQDPTTLKAQKVRPIPTWRLYQFLLLGLLIPLVAAFLGLPLWMSWGLVFLYDFGVVAIALQDYRRARQWQIQVERTCDPRLSIGRENPIHLKLTVGSGPQRQSQLQIRDLYPPEFRADQET
ncbi:MAG: hypothetical protein WA902_20435, partial [Thermosynechococcaceae cyanobacterium]